MSRLPQLRDQDAARAAVVQRYTLQREGLEKEEAQASERREDLHARLGQTQADLKREQEMLNDTAEAVARLDAENQTLRSSGDDAEHRAAAAKTMQACADKLAKSQEEADAANSELSSLSARRNALANAANEQKQRLQKLETEIADVTQKLQAISDETGGTSEAGKLSAFVEAGGPVLRCCGKRNTGS